MQDFKGLGLPALLMTHLEQMQYTTPTPIQAQSIPMALEGKDILGSAQTGTGKTAAFGIPLINKLMLSPRGTALVMTPTRELAVQVIDVLKKLAGHTTGLRAALIIGGESMPAQIQQLRSRPRIIVGTPGRINDHLERGTLMLNEVGFLVLDETDRMLDMGFAPQLEKILKFLPKTRQTLLFSATLPDNIVKLSSKYLTNPVRVAAGAANVAAPKITQSVIHTTPAAKYDDLVKELSTREGSVIIFVKTKFGADRLADKLNKQKFTADAIHGDLQQRKRERVIAGFRQQKFRILVATDIASRGLDIPHIEHVINYDLPQCPEDYIHRIGRTARAGAEGASVCLLTSEDREKWRAISRLMDPSSVPSTPGFQDSGRDKKPSGFNANRSRNSKKPRRFSGKSRRPMGNAKVA